MAVDSQEIKRLLLAGMSAEEVQVSGDGRHFDMLIVSKAFEGLRPLKRQQLVYGILNDHITGGALHAVNMKTLTPMEYAAA